MIDREDLINRLRALKPEIAVRFKVREIALFGSFLCDEETEESDVDLVVDFEDGADLFDLVGLGRFLEERLQRRVDLGTRQSLHPGLRERILSELAPI